MRKINFLFASFQTRVTIVLVLSIFLVAALSDFLIYNFSIKAQFQQLRDKLLMVTRTVSLMVDADKLQAVPLNPAGRDTQEYKSIAEELLKVKKANPQIKYIYTMAQTQEFGLWQFVVDPVALTFAEKKKGLRSWPGDKYDASRFPEMLKAFERSSVDRKFEVDEWGVTLSGYAPIRDKDGRSIAILGIDIAADDVYRSQQEFFGRSLFVLCLGIILAVLLGMLASKRMTHPVKKLVEGTRRISRGELEYRVKVKGATEIIELADSFNDMAGNLFQSRKELHEYFYKVVQSLIRILEARDPYTKGHSDRVAEYAEKIGLKMELSKEKLELLKETAELHDIGKLGIEERILNKKEKLTDEEWEKIRKHPAIGGEILKPVLLTKEMLEIVRGHHERYDGSGYPDKLIGGNINLFAQILSVADSYDAMTSPRAYRPSLGQEKAIEELRKNKGTQFNPKVVDIFLQVLLEEERG